MHMQIPAFAENRYDGRARFDQRVDACVLFHGVAREAGGSERDQAGVLQLHIARAKKELLVLRIRARPAALNIINAQLIQLVRNEDFVVGRETDVLALRAIAKRRIEGENSHKIKWRPVPRPLSSFSRTASFCAV